MEQHPHQSESADEADTEPWHRDAERRALRQPKIYVADLASMERGIDHGLWIDASQSAREIDTDIAAMLASSPVPGVKLWAIRAAEGFDGIDLTNVSDTTVITDIVRGLTQHGRAFEAWVRHIGDDYDQLSNFREDYVGSYQSKEAWAWSLAESLGWHQELDRQIPDELLRPYVTFDYAAIAQDASASWHVLTDPDGTVHIFNR